MEERNKRTSIKGFSASTLIVPARERGGKSSRRSSEDFVKNFKIPESLVEKSLSMFLNSIGQRIEHDLQRSTNDIKFDARFISSFGTHRSTNIVCRFSRGIIELAAYRVVITRKIRIAERNETSI